MKNWKGIIGFYLTVTVLTAVALMPFAANSENNLLYKPLSQVEDYFESTGEITSEYISEEVADTSMLNSETAEHSTEKDDSEFFAETSEYNFDENTYAETEETVTADEEYITSSQEENSTEDSKLSVSETEDVSESEINEPEPLEVSELLQDEFLYMPMHLSASYLADETVETVQKLQFLSPNVGYLFSANAVNTYEFTLDSRSVFSFSIAHGELDGAKGWKISVYGEYYLNGVSGDKGYRLLHIHNTDTAGGTEKSIELGLDAGNYRLTVTKGAAYTDAEYEIEVTVENESAYEIECNDNIFRYTEIYNSIEIHGSASCFDNKQDQDYYLFRMPESGFVDFSFSHPTVADKATVCWQIVLFAEDGTEILSFNSLFSDTSEKNERAGLLAGNYYVLVKNVVYTDITYTLELSRSYADSFESEPNGNEDLAGTLMPNSTVTGLLNSRIGGLDRDYYKFTVEKTGTVVIEFMHPSIAEDNDKNGWNVVLMNDKGEKLFTGVSLWGNAAIASPEIGLGGGTYYILIDSENIYHNTAQYDIVLTYKESDSWESESNNSFEKADMITADIPIFGILAECGTDFDFDYYTFELTEKTDLTLTFAHEILSYSRYIFEFSLYNGNKQGIVPLDYQKSNVSVSSDVDEVTAVYKELPPGKYYIKISTGLFYDNTKYTLSFSKGEVQ